MHAMTKWQNQQAVSLDHSLLWYFRKIKNYATTLALIYTQLEHIWNIIKSMEWFGFLIGTTLFTAGFIQYNRARIKRNKFFDVLNEEINVRAMSFRCLLNNFLYLLYAIAKRISVDGRGEEHGNHKREAPRDKYIVGVCVLCICVYILSLMMGIVERRRWMRKHFDVYLFFS